MSFLDRRIERRTLIGVGLALASSLATSACDGLTNKQRAERRWQELLEPEGNKVRAEMGELGLNDWIRTIKLSRLSQAEQQALELDSTTPAFFKLREGIIEFVVAMNRESSNREPASNLALIRQPLTVVSFQVDATREIPVVKFDYDRAQLIRYGPFWRDYKVISLRYNFEHDRYENPKQYFATQNLVKSVFIKGAAEDLAPLLQR